MLKLMGEKVLCMFLLMSLMGSIAIVGQSEASPSMVYLRVEPIPAYKKPIWVAIGTTFEVNVTVLDVENLYSFDFELYYDTTILDCFQEWVVITPFLKEPTSETIDVSDVDGVIRIAVSSIPPAEPKIGTGTLATITFNVTNAGKTKLDLLNDELLDPDGKPIPHITEGSWLLGVVTKLYVDPRTSTASVGEFFTINITLAEVENLYGWEFRFQWDPTLLEVVSYKFGYPDVPFLNPLTYKIDESEPTNGLLWLAEVSYSPAKAKNGSGTLATVSFNVLDKGSCVLDLHDTKLASPIPPSPIPPIIEPIPLGTVDGYFNNIAPEADLVRRSAWPEHHHYVVSKEELEDRHGTPGFQTLYGKVWNLGTDTATVKVVFIIHDQDGLWSTRVETGTVTIVPGEIIDVSYNLDPETELPAIPGKYYVLAQCSYQDETGAWVLGEKTKSFSFTVVP